MARAKVIHSTNSCMIKFEGDKRSPEPETGVIKFPGGHVEVTRTTDGRYWAHVAIDDPSLVDESRIDYTFAGYKAAEIKIPNVPFADQIKHIALLVHKPKAGSE